MKSTLKVLAPFATAVIVVIAFYLLGAIAAVLGLLSDCCGADSLDNFFGAIMEFLFIFSGEYPIGSTVVTIIVWIIITIIAEIVIEEES